ncbi:MAG: ADP-ribosylation factor-like protein [Candidatus Helarchaeota archaeon]
MLRDIYIIKNLKTLYHMQFGSSLDWDTLYPIIQSLSTYFEKASSDKIDIMNVGQFRITYSTNIKNRLFIIFISDLTDAIEDLEKQLIKARDEFMSMFEDLINESTDESAYRSFNPIAELIHQNLRPKIALVGFSGVGKTTISKLIRAEEIPTEHVPTMTGDIVTIKIGKLHFHLWDFAGQEQFSFLWPQFIQDSDAVLIVNDSTIQNIDKSKFFIDLVKKEVPNARLCSIANKQDLPEAMKPDRVEKLLGIKTYGMVAVDPENRAKMIQIFGELLNLSPQISPLIQPLLDRDKAIEEAEALLMKGDFERAIKKFRNIASLCRKLGDHKLSLEFSQRAKLIESKLVEHKKVQETSPELSQIPVKITDAQEVASGETSETSPLSKPVLQQEPLHEGAPKVKIVRMKESIEVPEIPPESKPLPPKVSSPIEQQDDSSIPSLIIPSTQYLRSNDPFNVIDRNLELILSNNYLQLDLLSQNSTQISETLSHYKDRPIIEFIKNIQTQISPDKLQMFPTLTLSSEKISSMSSGSLNHPLSPPATDSPNISLNSIEDILTNDEITPKDKIKYLKEELANLQQALITLKEDFEKGKISEKIYQQKTTELREERKNLQEKISDLSIQEIKRFDVSIPE